jgi:hypothetical protein
MGILIEYFQQLVIVYLLESLKFALLLNLCLAATICMAEYIAFLDLFLFCPNPPVIFIEGIICHLFRQTPL